MNVPDAAYPRAFSITGSVQIFAGMSNPGPISAAVRQEDNGGPVTTIDQVNATISPGVELLIPIVMLAKLGPGPKTFRMTLHTVAPPLHGRDCGVRPPGGGQELDRGSAALLGGAFFGRRRRAPGYPAADGACGRKRRTLIPVSTASHPMRFERIRRDRSFRISTGNSVMPCWLHSRLDRECDLTLRIKCKITIGAINQWEERHASANQGHGYFARPNHRVDPCFIFLGTAVVAAQNAKEMTPELQKVREALDKYQDPVVAVHDGYFSTLGCVEYPKPGAAGQVPYRAGGMGVHFFNVALMGKLDPLKPQVWSISRSAASCVLSRPNILCHFPPRSRSRPSCSVVPLRTHGRASSTHAA